MKTLVLCISLFLAACSAEPTVIQNTCGDVWLLDLTWTDGTCGVDGDESPYWIHVYESSMFETSWGDTCEGQEVENDNCPAAVVCNGLADTYGYELTFDLDTDGENIVGNGQIKVQFLVYESSCYHNFTVSGTVAENE